MPERILIIDDDKILLQNLKRMLETQNYLVETINVSKSVIEKLNTTTFECILLDVKMPGINGLDLLGHFNTKQIHTPVIMISGQSNIDTAVQAIKLGAFDFVEKPIDPDRLLVSIKNAIEKQHLLKEKLSLFEENTNIVNELEEKYRIVGKSRAIQKIFSMIEKASEVDAKVLITGDNGTGKELVAWAIHHNSMRKTKPYIKVNCASIPSELLESELFGHRKGSFTGAVSDQKGKFEIADGGTLFLDEIGELDIRMQAKLLRVLEENEIEVIGKAVPQKIDVRVIAATNKNLEQLISQGKFREDLYHRLDLIRIHLPPLQKRKDDILPLANYFLSRLNFEYNKRISKIHGQAEQLLLNHPWPGNVRELKNVIEKVVIFSDKNEIHPEDVLQAFGADINDNPLFNINNNQVLDIQTANQLFEKQYLAYVLKKMKNKRGAAAKALGIDRSNLYKKLKKHGLD